MSVAEPKNAARGFVVANYGKAHDEADYRKTLAEFAPKGATVYYTLTRQASGDYCLRLFSVWKADGQLYALHSLTNRPLFDALIAAQHYDADKIGYYGFNSTDGSRMAGFEFPAGVQSNVVLGIIYGLAGVVHGDRMAWKVRSLTGM